MKKPRILFSMPTRHHVEIALDEMVGMQEQGYACDYFHYAAKDGVTSKTGRASVLIQNALKLVVKCYRFKPDVIYLNSRVERLAGMRDWLTIRIVRSLYPFKTRFVIKSHGSDLDVLRDQTSRFGKCILPYLKRKVSGWLFLSSEEKQLVVNEGLLPAAKVFVTKNIVRPEQFVKDADFKKNNSIPDDHQVLLFAGRLIAEKGVFEVVNAFSKIKDSVNAVLMIVGWGPEEDALKQLVASEHLEDRIKFTGFIQEQEMNSYYANCDVLVFPTYFPEGFPMVLFNAIASGMPVITTRQRASADYLTQPENCLWVEPKDVDGVSKAIRMLLSSEQLQAGMKKNNQEKGKLFTKKEVCAELALILSTIALS
ncbi:glycosyltransferase family 4 protein [Mucilaginibacter sp. RS28]|uniref:Glycosyltransferase family 4 protein n=1 Tax=Mucilaginibacter straminoryzae TaxID=2932774 RepID=A0A9X1XA58_9SPHI|nr:glycosyltransferase family 4 protein [Mucilaginibacter straminoryzae]MCJ8211009.1 glycosyltransferase family 4 protein [Mucilaginibacter straminoryzae]